MSLLAKNDIYPNLDENGVRKPPRVGAILAFILIGLVLIVAGATFTPAPARGVVGGEMSFVGP